MTYLAILLRMPGRKVLQQLLPLALGGGSLLWLQTSTTCKADSIQATNIAASPADAATGGKSPGGKSAGAGVTPQPGIGALPALLQRLLGQQNEFASGGLTLMVVGAAAAGARVVIGAALRYCKRHVMVQAEVDSRDDAYRWLMFWLSRHPKFEAATNVSVTTNLSGTFGTSVPAIAAAAGASGPAGSGPPVAFLPAPGDHLLRYKGHWMLISRQRTSGNPQLAANARLLMETLRISMFGTNRAPLEQLISEAAATYNASQSCRTAVHSVDQDGYWSQVGSRPIRPLNTVVLPEGQAESLLADCQEFLGSESWYAHHGIPYRRGYLLYGPPGTGKTSLVMALAGTLGLEIYVVTLSSPTMTDETLRNLLNTAGARSILLLEDVDAAFVDRSAGQGAARLTFSGLLNAIDGVAAQEGRLLFMTTNHIERLSSALIRPGRVDVRCCLGPATREQARKMFVAFFLDLPQQLALRPAAPATVAAAAGTKAAGKVAAAGLGRRGDGSSPASGNWSGAASAAPPSQPPSAEVHGSTTTSSTTSSETAPLLSGKAAGLQQQQAGAEAPSTGGLPGEQAARPPDLFRSVTAKEAAEREAGLAVLAEEFAAQLPDEPMLSTAQLQAYLMAHRLSPTSAVAGAGAWVQQQLQARQLDAE